MESLKASRAVVAALFAGGLLAVAGTALAAGGKGPAKATILATGSESMRPNAYYTNTFQFQAGTVPIRSGGTVTLRNTTRDAHTLSLVKQSQVPRTLKQMENCKACGEIARHQHRRAAHGSAPDSAGGRRRARVRLTRRLDHPSPEGSRRSGEVQGHRSPWDHPELRLHHPSVDVGTLPGEVAPPTGMDAAPQWVAP
jgi:plastocyanin